MLNMVANIIRKLIHRWKHPPPKPRKFWYRWQQHPFDRWHLFSVLAFDQATANIKTMLTFEGFVNRGQTVMRLFYPVKKK